jgi:hypothetical protein
MSVFDEVNKIGSQDLEVEVFLKSLKDKYLNVFQTENKSTINSFEISIRLKENVNPVFKKAYNIPLAFNNKVKHKHIYCLSHLSIFVYNFPVSPTIGKISKKKQILCGKYG